jgi:ABC-type lipoprotein release transport system permease subunit
VSAGLWAGTAVRFLRRSWRASTVLALMVASAVAALTVLSALAVGVNDAMVRNSVGLYAGHVTGEPLPPDLDPRALEVEGTLAVLRRVSLAGVLTGPARSQGVDLVLVDPPGEAGATALPRKVRAGRYLTPGAPGLFLSAPLARALGVGPGDTVRFSGAGSQTGTGLVVTGLYETGVDRLDRGVAFAPHGTLPEEGATWSAAVFLRERVDPGTVIATYARDLPALADRFRAWDALMPGLKQLIDLNYVSMGVVTGLVFGVVALGLACAFVIFVLRHLREYGVMKAMGASVGEVAGLILIEVGLMSLAAAAVGSVVGVATVLALGQAGIDLGAFTSRNPYFAVSGVIYPRLTGFSAGLPPLLALLFGLLAAIWPASLVGRRSAAEILRSL